ncbi:MAG: biliverdin-producing heme oxygenase [Gemmatimonadaceae bacterium]
MTNKDNVLSRLKESTSDAHARVEEALRLTDDTLDLGRYLRLLSTMRSVHIAADLLLAPFKPELAALGYQPAERKRVEWIDEDLMSLGGSWHGTTSSAIEKFEVNSVCDCLGMIYVLEGSTLGGQIIASAVARSLALTPPNGCRYYIGYGSRTGSRWKETRDTIDGYSASSAERELAIDTIIGAANRAFETILSEARAQNALPVCSDKLEYRVRSSPPDSFHVA